VTAINANPGEAVIDRETQVWNGAVEILAAAKSVPFEHRFDAFALAFDAFVRTSGTIDVDYPEDRLDVLWCLSRSQEVDRG
jgi:hypothetical protein